jgi:hypothetical protein
MVQLNTDTSKFTPKLQISLVEINIIESADLLSLCGKLDPFHFGKYFLHCYEMILPRKEK